MPVGCGGAAEGAGDAGTGGKMAGRAHFELLRDRVLLSS